LEVVEPAIITRVIQPSKTARSVGEILRHAREDQKLTLEQVARDIHIRTRFLEALEATDLQALPSLAQSRGFLRLYAEHLGLDPRPLLETWQPLTHLPAEPVASVPAEKKPSGLIGLAKALLAKDLPDRSDRSAIPSQDEEPEMVTSEKLFTEIGRKLVRQREAMEMSFEEAALLSRIKPQTLQLIEKMDMQELPSPVIVRGLLLTYADAIQADREELLSLYADALQTRRDERNQRQNRLKTGSSRISNAPLIAIDTTRFKKIDFRAWAARLSERFPFLKKYLNFDLLVGGVLVMVLAVVIIWAAASTLSLNSQQVGAQATLPGRSEILAAGPTEDSTGESQLDITPTLFQELVPSSTTGLDPVGISAQATYLITLPANADAAFRVTVRPLQTAFVQIWVDDRLAFRGRMAPGADYPFNAIRRVELLTGDASALQLLFNTTDLGIMGIPGEVIHIVFTARGAQTITPTMTMTFTPTRRPTLTPRPTTTKKPTRTPTP
jgi:transcriptional regulator with XRE-family HTH domain